MASANSYDNPEGRHDQDSLTGTPNMPVTDEIIEYENGSCKRLGLEDYQRYNKGGFHPVHLDDILDGRFEVVHKLGNGGFGIVWLCRDITLEKWRAVKVMAADHSSSGTEEKILSHLRNTCTPKELEDNHIMMPLEQFWLEGPNGRHICQVLPVCGLQVSNWRLKLLDYKPGTEEAVRNVCGQIVKSLHFLHSHGICHGDFRPANILMKIEGIDELDKEEVLEMLGEIAIYDIETTSGEPAGPRAPEYSVQPVDQRWCKKLWTNSIAIIDFGESFFTESPPQSTGIPALYAAPEVLFKGTGSLGPHSDIWSLACTIYEIRTVAPLFASDICGGFGIPVLEIESYLGPMPPKYSRVFFEMLRSIRAPRSVEPEHSNREPDQTSEVQPEQTSEAQPEQEGSLESQEEGPSLLVFEEILGQEQRVYRDLQDPKDVPAEFQSSEFITWRDSQEEVAELADLMRQMLKYNPDERSTIEAIASHPWVIHSIV
ncbi:kinase-like protein [Hypoxylon rubiginosum]|uniref:Kinase-like protein n=1 Tax=Hypoxylon rubiginosum TaxID=110542 RepID=A0ACC0CMD9_9PEZI|nr:kinase-like protein [Hypoxylon rubiginosum]